jgi:hypothetical protein
MDTTTNLETWLKGVGSLALKAMAEDMPNVRESPKPKVIAWILQDEPTRERAMESKRIDEERVRNG